MNAPLPAGIDGHQADHPATQPVTGTVNRSARQAEVLAELAPLLPAHALLWHTEDTIPYECDGLTAYRQRPLAVALPETEAQVQAVRLFSVALPWRA